jgi:hypothetical protein
VQVDTSRHAVHLWSLHALGVVAQHAGPGFHRQARGALDLALALLNSPEASYAPSAAGLRAAAGRLVNAAAAAIGPELDPEGAPFARASALIAAVRDGGDTSGGGGGGGSGGGGCIGSGGGGGRVDDLTEVDARGGTEDGDAACQLEAALFLQQLVLFAPRAAPPARLVPRLRPVLAVGGLYRRCIQFTHSLKGAWFQTLNPSNHFSWFQNLLSNGSTCTATSRRVSPRCGALRRLPCVTCVSETPPPSPPPRDTGAAWRLTCWRSW